MQEKIIQEKYCWSESKKKGARNNITRKISSLHVLDISQFNTLLVIPTDYSSPILFIKTKHHYQNSSYLANADFFVTQVCISLPFSNLSS